MRSLLCTMLFFAVTMPATAQVNSEKYRSLFLVGEFGEVCTMCEVIVICGEGDHTPEYDSIPADDSFTIYHLQTRTFWSQVSTIWEWFIANFSSESLVQGHTRPVWIYEIVGGRWTGPDVIEAHIALEPPLLSFGDRKIDRTNQAWLKDGETVGYCRRLPLWESLDVIANETGGGESR